MRRANYQRLLLDSSKASYTTEPRQGNTRQVLDAPTSGTERTDERTILQQANLLIHDDQCAARTYIVYSTCGLGLGFSDVMINPVIYQPPSTRRIRYNTDLERHLIRVSGRQSLRVSNTLTIQYSFGLAVAVNDLMDDDPTDGLLGLGLSE